MTARRATARRRPAAAEPARARTAAYAYCIVRSAAAQAPGLRAAPAGLPGATRPRAVGAGHGLWLILADAPLDRYGEAALAGVVRDLDAVARCAVAHSAVVAHCARRWPVLPLRLFTLFASEARAVAQVRRRRRALAARLARVAGRAEWGVQVRLAGGPGARRAPEVAGRELSRLSPGRRFLERRRRERDAARVGAAAARAAAAAVYQTLARSADAARRHPTISRDGRPALLLDAAFLVRGTRAASFRRAVKAHAGRLAGHGLRVRLTGPWPPYSFVAGRL